MSEKMGDLTVTDIRAALAKEKRDIAVLKAEIEFSEDKLKLLCEELTKRVKGEENG